MRHALTVVAVAFLSTPAVAQSPGPFTTERQPNGPLLLSYPLEARFSEFLRDCGGVPTPLQISRLNRFGRSDRRTLSAIDPRIINALGLTTQPTIEANLNMSIDRVFGHVYAVNNFSRSFGPSDEYLRLDYVDNDKIQPLGFPDTQLSSTCGSILAGALSANADFTLPVTSLQAAVNADSSSSTRSSLEITDGAFRSPIWDMWSGENVLVSDQPRRKVFAALLFWDWYASSSQYRRTNPVQHYLLRSFTGTVAYRRTSSQTTASSSASINGRVGVPFISANADFSGNVNQTSSFTATRFNVLVRSRGGVDTYRFEPLPSIANIVSVAEANTVSQFRVPDGGRMVENGQQKTFLADLSGLPAAFCNETAWEVRDSLSATTSSSTLSLGRPSQTPGSGEMMCTMPIIYSAPSSGTAVDLALRPVLFSTTTLEQRQLRLPLDELRIDRTAGPEWSLVSQTDPVVTPANGTTPQAFNLRWTFNFTVRNIGQYNDINRIDVSNLKLDCPGVITHDAVVEGAFSGPASPSSRTLILTVNNFYQGPYSGPANPPAYDRQPCKVNGYVSYTKTDGSLGARRDIPEISVTFPRPVVPPAAPPQGRESS